MCGALEVGCAVGEALAEPRQAPTGKHRIRRGQLVPSRYVTAIRARAADLEEIERPFRTVPYQQPARQGRSSTDELATRSCPIANVCRRRAWTQGPGVSSSVATIESIRGLLRDVDITAATPRGQVKTNAVT